MPGTVSLLLNGFFYYSDEVGAILIFIFQTRKLKTQEVSNLPKAIVVGLLIVCLAGRRGRKALEGAEGKHDWLELRGKTAGIGSQASDWKALRKSRAKIIALTFWGHFPVWHTAPHVNPLL